jgi:ferric-dicitrate binding protein FerR (iron transport regulator)
MKTKSSVRAQAARWLFALETAESFEDLWPRFQGWLNEDARHREAYLALEKAWRQVASLGSLGPDNELKDLDILFKMDLRTEPSAAASTWASARAIGAIVSITVTPILIWHVSGALRHEIASAVHRFLLPQEDSTMTLNAQTRVLPGLARRSRDFGVLRGEVLLKAQHDPLRAYEVRGAYRQPVPNSLWGE